MKKAIVFSLIFAFGFLFLSYLPNLYEASLVDKLPSDRTMIWGEHIYTYDYNVYLSKITQGMEGRWSVVNKYDNQPQSKSVFLQMVYLLSGKVGGLFKFSAPLIFHLMRTLFSFGWVLMIVFLNVYFLRKPRLYFWGIIVSLLASSFPTFYKIDGQFWIGYHMDWWQEMDVLKRVSYLPHYTLNYVIIAVLTYFMFQFDKKINAKTKNQPVYQYFLSIAIILFFSFFIHPSAGLVFLASWAVFYLIKIFWQPKIYQKQLLSLFFYTIILFFVAIIPLLYIKSTTSAASWKGLLEFDQKYHLPLNFKEYVLSLGPVFFSGILGLILVLKRKEEKFLPLVTWLLGAFIGMTIFMIFPLPSPARFVQTANHIPLAILTVYFLFIANPLKYDIFEDTRFEPITEGDPHQRVSVGEKRGIENVDQSRGFNISLSKIKAKILNFLRYKNLVSSFPKVLAYFWGIIIIINGFVQTYFSLKSQMHFINQRAMATLPLVPYPSQVMYPLTDFYNGLVWLEKNTSRSTVVLAKITAGNYIPAYAGNFVYLGHNPETPDFENREYLLNNFFAGSMDKDAAYKFLVKNNINFVFYGPQEKENAVGNIEDYSFLKPVFRSFYVTIYQVLQVLK